VEIKSVIQTISKNVDDYKVKCPFNNAPFPTVINMVNLVNVLNIYMYL